MNQTTWEQQQLCVQSLQNREWIKKSVSCPFFNLFREPNSIKLVLRVCKLDQEFSGKIFRNFLTPGKHSTRGHNARMPKLIVSILFILIFSEIISGNVLDGYQLVHHPDGVLKSFSFVQGNVTSNLKIEESVFGNFGSLPLSSGSHRLVRFHCTSVNYICNCSNNDTFSFSGKYNSSI